MSLIIVLGVAGMHGLGLLAGCGGGHGGAPAAAATDRAHAAEFASAPMIGHGTAAALTVVRADFAPAVTTARASGHGGCHLLHLCLAVLAGLTVLLMLRAVTRAGPTSSPLAAALQAAAQARGPPRPRWGPLELCVSRT